MIRYTVDSETLTLGKNTHLKSTIKRQKIYEFSFFPFAFPCSGCQLEDCDVVPEQMCH